MQIHLYSHSSILLLLLHLIFIYIFIYINHFFFDTRERMGLTEFEAVEKMYNGVEEMIRMEKELEAENAGEE